MLLTGPDTRKLQGTKIRMLEDIQAALRVTMLFVVMNTQLKPTLFQGYNYRNYKATLPGLQSQGREQVHSQLDKITRSLRQCNFQSYMILMKTF